MIELGVDEVDKREEFASEEEFLLVVVVKSTC